MEIERRRARAAKNRASGALATLSVMPDLVPGIHVLGRFRRKDVDGRDIRRVNAVFDGYAHHDGKELE